MLMHCAFWVIGLPISPMHLHFKASWKRLLLHWTCSWGSRVWVQGLKNIVWSYTEIHRWMTKRWGVLKPAVPYFGLCDSNKLSCRGVIYHKMSEYGPRKSTNCYYSFSLFQNNTSLIYNIQGFAPCWLPVCGIRSQSIWTSVSFLGSVMNYELNYFPSMH